MNDQIVPGIVATVVAAKYVGKSNWKTAAFVAGAAIVGQIILNMVFNRGMAMMDSTAAVVDAPVAPTGGQ